LSINQSFDNGSWKFSRESLLPYKFNCGQDPLPRPTPHVDEISEDQQFEFNVTDTLYSPNNVDTILVSL